MVTSFKYYSRMMLSSFSLFKSSLLRFNAHSSSSAWSSLLFSSAFKRAISVTKSTASSTFVPIRSVVSSMVSWKRRKPQTRTFCLGGPVRSPAYS